MLVNPYRGQQTPLCPSVPFPSVDADSPLALLAKCPHYARTPLQEVYINNTHFFVKDERQRMGLGSFKALGAAYVIAQMAQQQNLSDTTFVCASAGNHGLSVAAGAQVFGAKAVIYLAQTVPESFAERLRGFGAAVCRVGEQYEAAMSAAMTAAEENGWVLLSDSSWAGYVDLPWRVMEGYTAMAAEICAQMDAPEAIYLQAGVGGMAAACAAYFRAKWGDTPQIYVVEPQEAPALHHSIRAGKSVKSAGAVSAMGRLDCKEPSLIALNGLARDADAFVLIDDAEVQEMLAVLEVADCTTTPSGGAGMVAALCEKVPSAPDGRVLCIVSEGGD